MIGSQKGLVSRLAALNPALLYYSQIYFVHNECGMVKETLDTACTLYSLLSATQTLQGSTGGNDFLLHSDVGLRWSK